MKINVQVEFHVYKKDTTTTSHVIPEFLLSTLNKFRTKVYVYRTQSNIHDGVILRKQLMTKIR